MQKWGFTKVVTDTAADEYGNQEDIFHWEADMDTCLQFWGDAVEGWEVTIPSLGI